MGHSSTNSPRYSASNRQYINRNVGACVGSITFSRVLTPSSDVSRASSKAQRSSVCARYAARRLMVLSPGCSYTGFTFRCALISGHLGVPKDSRFGGLSIAILMAESIVASATVDKIFPPISWEFFTYVLYVLALDLASVHAEGGSVWG